MHRLIASGTQAAVQVVVTTDEAVDVCLGFYEVRDGQISDGVEYWTKHVSQPTPSWRAKWTEQMVTDDSTSPGSAS